MKSPENPNSELARIVAEDPEFLRSVTARPLRILGEYLHPAEVFERAGVTDTITFFGSARLRPPADLEAGASAAGGAGSKDAATAKPGGSKIDLSGAYRSAMDLGQAIARWSAEHAEPRRRKVLVMTGGGPGIMEAANRGAAAAGAESSGLSIQLPFEDAANPYVTPELNFHFQYFFMRKYWFLYFARALVVFPGGFGTLDERFETLTLQQTRHIQNVIPIFLFGKSFWERLIDFDFLAEAGMISPEDHELFHIVDSVDEAMRGLTPILERAVQSS